MAGPLTINFQNETNTPVDERQLIGHLQLILQRLSLTDNLEIEIVVVGDHKIQTLNKEFLGHNYPTDVLSFPVEAEIAGEQLLGSIVLSVDTAKRQAKAAGVNLVTELKMLTGHGLLHLLGYHHR